MSVSTQDLARRLSAASSDTQRLVRVVLEQDETDRQWAAQVGPALSQADVARLLSVSAQAISKSKGLLRLSNRDGRVIYPVMQFDGRRPLPGLAQVISALSQAFVPWTIASWLSVPMVALDGRSAIQALRDGDAEQALVLAQQAARSAA